MRSYYNRSTPNQLRGVFTRPTAGLNEYNSSINITDNHFSDVLDGSPYRDDSVVFDVTQTLVAGVLVSGNDGIVLEATSIQNTDNYALLAYNKSTPSWHIRVVNPSAPSVTNYTLTGFGLPVPNLPSFDPVMTDYIYSSTNFSTEASQFVCFSCNYTKALMFLDYTNSVVNKVTLSFYPKKILTHANRVFAIDTSNKIWWCRAGDLYSWYGMEYDDDMLMAATDMANVTYTLTAQPDVARPVTATVTKTSTIDTLGSLALVGTNVLNQPQSETLVPVDGRVQSLKSYKTVAITHSGWSGVAGTDKIAFGVAPVSGGYVQDDAGYWTLENEKSLTDMCILSNNLYVFGVDTIYIFRGYSPDTFTLNTAIIGMGIKEPPTPRKWLTSTNNTAYFYMNGDIYEFNGYDYPRLISHPIEVNGQSSNGIFSGVGLFTTDYTLASDNNKVYVYNDTTTLFNTNYYYEFNIKTKNWFRKSGFSKLNSVYTATAFRVFYVTKANTDTVVSFISVNSAAGSFNYHTVLGHKGLYNPYLITKAYNASPSELGTLTTIILQIKGLSTAKADVVVSYSTLASGTSFTEFKRFTEYDFNDDIQSVEIPVPVNAIASTHHYRIKIEFDGYVELYNIERRFRVRGMSR